MAEAVAKKKKVADEFAESVIKIRRVSKVVKGGRRFSFSALVVVGDKKGKVGVALGKGGAVAAAISKASRRARKAMVSIPLYKTTIPYTVEGKYGASKVIIRSASKGTGVIAGGAIRNVMEALGVHDILTKSLGTANPQNVVKATMNALSKLHSAQSLARMRGKTVKEICGVKDVATK